MGPVSASTVIDAPREQVFETLSDLALRPAFCDHFLDDYRLASLPASGVGAAARFRVSPPAGKTWMDTVIAELDRPHQISERGHCGRSNRIPAFTSWELLEIARGQTTLRLTFFTDPSNPLDRAREHLGAARWYERKWSVALRRLKLQIEAGEPMVRVRVAGADRLSGSAA
jgi:uncharacterized protein YndB with AHSA1/START domain